MGKKKFTDELDGILGEQRPPKSPQTSKNTNKTVFYVDKELGKEIKLIAIMQGKTIQKLTEEVLRDYATKQARKTLEAQMGAYQKLLDKQKDASQ